MAMDTCAYARFLPEFILDGIQLVIGLYGVDATIRGQAGGEADGGIAGVSAELQYALRPHHAAPILQKLALNGIAEHLRRQDRLPCFSPQFGQNSILFRAVAHRVGEQLVVQLMGI